MWAHSWLAGCCCCCPNRVDVIAATAVKQIVRLNVAAVFASTVIASAAATFFLLTNR